MKLNELLEKIDDHKLAYHDTLNPKFWDELDGSWELKLQVKQKLIKIAQEFVKALNLPDAQVKDFVLTGSNANFNWTSLSDIDLHIIVDMKSICDDCKSIDAKDCFDAKKSLWNDRHDITIYGFPVELYASDSRDNIIGDSGIYSLLESRWLKVPERKNIEMDSRVIKAKADDIAYQIDDLIDSKTTDKDVIKELTNKIANYRKSGLAKGGEFSVENLTFKALRNNGYIDKIRKYAVKAEDHTLSLEESLDSIVKIDVDVEDPEIFNASAKINGRAIDFMAHKNQNGIWTIEFIENGEHFAMTGSGKEFQVFAMIRKCFETFTKKYSPKKIKFVANKSEKHRADVYQNIVKRFIKGYKINCEDCDDIKIFHLEKE